MTALPDSELTHQGHDLESGLLVRVREWTDIFGWLRLIRVLRAAGSPTLIGLVVATYWVWTLGLVFAGGGFVGGAEGWSSAGGATLAPSSFSQGGQEAALGMAGMIAEMNPGSLVSMMRGLSLWRGLLMATWSMVLWTPVVLVLVRQGALLTADRNMESTMVVGKRSLRRCGQALLAPWIPCLCVVPLIGMMVVLGFLLRSVTGQWWFELPLAALTAVAAFIAGLLLFGGLFAVPLSLAAIANEEQPDPLDGLSRGYEVFLRRPLSLLINLLVAVGLILLVAFMVQGICFYGTMLTMQWIGSSEAGGRGGRMVMLFVSQIRTCVLLTLTWALMGGVYLLVRESTGEQQVEDLWSPPPPAEPELPTPSV